MRKATFYSILIFSIVGAGFFLFKNTIVKEEVSNKLEKKLRPNDYFENVRAYPFGKVDLAAYKAGIEEVKTLKANVQNKTSVLNWVQEGPTNLGGRINTIAVDPSDENIMYVGNAKGGVFKTTNGGTSWFPIFDDQTFLSIGDIEIDPVDPNIVFVGTGDPNISASHYIGDGLYKSTDGGNTWTNIGLSETFIISHVKIHPQQNNVIYVSAMGKPQEANSDRGLYKSVDAGNTWNQVLYVGDSTGIIDLVLHPTNPDIVYCASWDRYRTDYVSIVSGEKSRIYKTIDGGNNWEILSNGLPYDSNYYYPETTISRIGISLDPTNPERLYAQIVGSSLNTLGVFKTEDAGANWSQVSDVEPSGGFGWYFGKCRINPFAPNNIFALGVDLWRTANDGIDWEEATPAWWTYEVHADKHDIFFLGPNSYLLATDGGMYKTTDDGYTWTDVENIANSQFYHVKVNPHQVGDYWGGMQDNGTSHGNSANINDWPRTYGGDGFNVEFRKDNPNVIYVETQWGNILVSNDGGYLFTGANDGFNIYGDDRVNWNAPFIVSQHNPNVMYRGSEKMYKSTAGIYPFWEEVSGDLSDGTANETINHEISDISESPIDANVIYVGTTDANVHISEDEGLTYTDITGNLPNYYVTDVEAGNDVNTVFVTHSGYRSNNFIPHVHASLDKGQTWINISSNLPQIGVNDIEQHPLNDSLLFVATDASVFYSENFGGSWNILGNNLPNLVTSDVEIDLAQNKLIAGTFARSIWSIDLSEIFTTPTLTIETETEYTICEGESLQLNVNGGNLYSWSGVNLSCFNCNNPVANPNISTLYEVEVCLTANICETELIYVQVVNQLVNPVIDFDGNELSTNIYAQNYQWLLNGDTIPNATSNVFQPTENGDYSLLVSNSTCDALESLVQNVVMTNTIVASNSSIKVYPNPTEDILNIASETAIKNVKVSGLNGQILLKQNQVNKIDLNALKAGFYILEVELISGKIFQEKIQKL